MAKDLKRIPDLDDIIFNVRNKEYGAYVLRKKYNRNIIISILIGIIIIASAIITPYLNARALENRHQHVEKFVEIKMENLNQPDEMIAPPLPPPPPPVEDVLKQVKYVPPVVVDSLKSDDTVQFMISDEAQTKVKNEGVVEINQEVKEEVREKEAEPEPFLSVEEMPVPLGGEAGLYKYIADNLKYPKLAIENNIQGKVFIRFCVTSKGNVDQVSILKGVEPELDAEAIRVVKSFPPFIPGKMSGKPVPVWYIVHINFRLE
jgi:periplasmic protein TonB